MLRKLTLAFLIIAMANGLRPLQVLAGNTVPLTQWMVVEPGDGKSLNYEGGAAVFHYTYRPGKFSALMQPVSLAGFQEIRFTVESSQQTMMALMVEDLDGAKFRCGKPIPSQKEVSFTIHPSDCQLNDDSPVKKASLDPSRLSTGFVLLDPNVMGNSGENILRIKGVVVGTESSVSQTASTKSGPLTVDSDMTISENTELNGDIILKPGGRLLVTAPRFVLHGNVQGEGGSLEISGGTFVVPERYMYEHHMFFARGGDLTIRNAILDTTFQYAIRLDNATLTVQNAKSHPFVTTDLNGNTKVRFNHVDNWGEFTVPPEADLSIQNSRGLVFWLTLGANAQGELNFPPPGRIENWSPGHGLDLTIRNSEAKWSIISKPGSNIVIRNANIEDAGIYFTGNAKVTLSGLQDDATVDDYWIPARDRKIRFMNTKVHAWTVYTYNNAEVTIENSTFGETNTADDSSVQIKDSVCDGNGGYVAAQDRSRIRLVNSTSIPLILSRGNSTVTLEDSHAKGDIRSIENAAVRLIRSQVDGKTEKEGNASLTNER